MAQIKQVGIGRKSTGTIDGITYYVRGGVTYARSTPNMPASVYNTPEAKKRQAIFKMIQMHLKYHLRTIRQTFTPKGNGSPSNRYYSLNNRALSAALDSLAELYSTGQDVTVTDVETAIAEYAAEHPTSIRIASLSGYHDVFLTGPWPARIVLNALAGDSTVIVIVNENGTQTTINADGTKTIEIYSGETGESSSGSTEGSNSSSGSTEGSEGNGGNGGSVDPAPVTPETPAAGETFSITAGVGSDGGGSVSIKKNGAVVEGGSVQASGSDTVVIEAVPENANFQFMSWSDGNSQNPRTIQPSADMNVTANFLDLSKI
jgi:hypothetical protein